MWRPPPPGIPQAWHQIPTCPPHPPRPHAVCLVPSVLLSSGCRGTGMTSVKGRSLPDSEAFCWPLLFKVLDRALLAFWAGPPCRAVLGTWGVEQHPWWPLALSPPPVMTAQRCCVS